MLTDRGLCYTFNSDSMQKLFKQTKYLDTLKKHLTDWQGHKHDEEGNLKEPLMISTISCSKGSRSSSPAAFARWLFCAVVGPIGASWSVC